jgi:hypothetical protein
MPGAVIGIGLEVEVFDVFRVVQRIDLCTRILIDGSKWPAVCIHLRRYNRRGFEMSIREFRRFVSIAVAHI